MTKVPRQYCWISSFDDEKIMSFDNLRIYSILIFELYLTSYILKIQKSNISKTGRHASKKRRHTEQKV